MDETRRLAQFVAETGYEDLPQSVIEATRVYILDNLASGLVGSGTPWADMVGELAQESAPNGPCSVFNRQWTTSPSYSALVNGTMIGGFETDHAFFAGSCHPSAAVFPAALAVAERDHLNGSTLLVSVALGYEVACRVGLAATRAVEDVTGFHGPGTNASFGGAAGAGKALGLTADPLVNALGIAGSHAGGLLEFAKEGAMTKRIHVGRGGQMGLECALLAAKGFTGPSTVLEGDRGFLKAYSPEPRLELLNEGLGENYVMMDMTVKAYACHISFHPIIEGIWRFRENHSGEGNLPENVKIVATERVVKRHGQREPTSVLGAQYSLPFSVAVALCRDVTNPLVYNEETLWDPQVRGLAQSVELSTHDRFGEAGGPSAEIEVTSAGDTDTFTVTGWKGHPSDPYSYDEMADKFRRYAGPFLPEASIEHVIQKVRRLEEVTDIAELTQYCRSG